LQLCLRGYVVDTAFSKQWVKVSSGEKPQPIELRLIRKGNPTGSVACRALEIRRELPRPTLLTVTLFRGRKFVYEDNGLIAWKDSQSWVTRAPSHPTLKRWKSDVLPITTFLPYVAMRYWGVSNRKTAANGESPIRQHEKLITA